MALADRFFYSDSLAGYASAYIHIEVMDLAPEISKEIEFWLPDLCNPLAFLRLILLGVFIAIALTLLREGLKGFMLAEMGRLFLYTVWIVFVSAIGLCQLRKLGSRLSVFQSSSLAVFWLVLSASVCAWIACNFALQIYVDDDLTFFAIWSETTLLTLLLGSLVLRFLYVHHELQRQQRQLMQAQYDALQARIRPHFLFNSLNSIAALAGLDPQRAEKAILDLSDLLRATLGEKNQHSLADELKVCAKYLDIEALRMGERMQISIDVEPELNAMPVPSLFLQPLLENAVIHGLQPLPEGGCIELAIKRSGTEQNIVVVELKNPVPEQPQNSKGSGSAMLNIQARLKQFYPDKVQFSSKQDAGLFKVCIEIKWP